MISRFSGCGGRKHGDDIRGCQVFAEAAGVACSVDEFLEGGEVALPDGGVDVEGLFGGGDEFAYITAYDTQESTCLN